ncbi:MAG TPA: hypothetical protein VI306_26280 [Pyrinomonadaceae bacterium]
MTDEQISKCIGALFKMAKASVARSVGVTADQYLEQLICEADRIRPLSVPLKDLRAGFVERYSPQVKRAVASKETLVIASTFEADIVARRKIERPNANIETSAKEPEIQSARGVEPKRTAKRRSKPIPRPPINVEFVLHLLLTSDEQDAVIGDLLERYVVKYDHLGKWRTDVWFCVEVLRSVWPFLKRTVGKVSGLMLLGEWLRKMIH